MPHIIRALDVQAKAGKLALIVVDCMQRLPDRASKDSTREENVGMFVWW